MKIKKSHPFRKTVRQILALTFWVHAAGLLAICDHLLPALSHASLRYLYNIALVAFILYYSYLSDRGWFSVIYDLMYVYLWPFITTFSIAWLFSKNGYKYVKSELKFPQFSLLIEPKTPVESSPGKLDLVEATTAKDEKPLSSPTRKLITPIFQFCLLWAALILTDNEKVSLGILSFIALIGAARALALLWNIRTDTSSWTGEFKAKFAEQMKSKIDLIMNWTEGSDHKNLRNELNALNLYEAVFTFVEDNRQFLSRCTIAIAVAITVPFYCYISVLLSLTYFGIAKIQDIAWTWPSALSTSLYMPFAYTDLPHSFLIRILGGLQGIAVGIMGLNILSKHLTRHFESIVNASVELRQPFVNQMYKEKVQRLTVLSQAPNLDVQSKVQPKSVRIGNSRRKQAQLR